MTRTIIAYATATLALAGLATIAVGCNAESVGTDDTGPPPSAEHCGAAGSVETTVSDLSGTFTDVSDTPLAVDPSRQMLDEDLVWNLIEVGDSGFWSITGSLRWTGMLELDSVTGLESGVPHSANIYYELSTGALGGLVFVPLEPEDAEGSISATLSSQYDGGARRTKYGFGIRQNYIGTSTDMTVDWRYHAATDELIFEGVGTLDLGDFDPYEDWVANPVVTVCLSAADVPPDAPSPLFAGFAAVGVVGLGLTLRRRWEEC